MNLDAKIYIAGHRGLVGSALMRKLQAKGYSKLLTRTHAELDLRNVVGYPGEILFDPTQPDGTPRKLLDVGRLNGLGWFPMTEMVNGLSQAFDAYTGKRD